jgi:hypothetical protein
MVNGQSVAVRVTSLPGGGPAFTAGLICTWHPGYAPTDTDAALVGVLADHATAVVHRERTTGQLTDSATAQQVGAALGGVQRVAAATGILMALHHLTSTPARQLLARASDRTHRSLLEVADSVLTTGALPENRTTGALPENRTTGALPENRTTGALPENRTIHTGAGEGKSIENGRTSRTQAMTTEIKGRPPDQPVTARAQFFCCTAMPPATGASRDAVR